MTAQGRLWRFTNKVVVSDPVSDRCSPPRSHSSSASATGTRLRLGGFNSLLIAGMIRDLVAIDVYEDSAALNFP